METGFDTTLHEVGLRATAGRVAVLEALWGQGLRDNPLLAGLDLADLPAALSA